MKWRSNTNMHRYVQHMHQPQKEITRNLRCGLRFPSMTLPLSSGILRAAITRISSFTVTLYHPGNWTYVICQQTGWNVRFGNVNKPFWLLLWFPVTLSTSFLAPAISPSFPMLVFILLGLSLPSSSLVITWAADVRRLAGVIWFTLRFWRLRLRWGFWFWRRVSSLLLSPLWRFLATALVFFFITFVFRWINGQLWFNFLFICGIIVA